MKLFKNCVLIDAHSKYDGSKVDILVQGENIERIEKEIEVCPEYACYDMNNAYVSAGWIDIHTHCFEGTTDISIDADKIGVNTGVVCIVDAGSSGANNIDAFYRLASEKKTIVKAWLNIASTGLEDRHELKDLSNIDVEKTIEKAKAYEEFVIGIKVRASASVMSEDMQTPFVKAREVSKRIGKPIMVHIGNFPPTIDEVISELGAGDVLTHCYHGKPNGVLLDGEIRKTILDKRTEGLQYDVGHGQESFSFAVAKKAIELGFRPDTISSDLHKYNYEGPVCSLSNVMTKMLALLPLGEVIHYVTSAAAQLVNADEFGRVDVGRKAHLTFFRVHQEDVQLVDSVNEAVDVTKIIKPVSCLVAGKYWEVATW